MSREREAFVRVAKTSEIPPGRGRAFEVAGRRIAVYNLGGRFYAIDDRCTHEEAWLSEGPVMGEMAVCPRHGSRFHIPTGQVKSLPAVRNVATYEVRVEGEEVYVNPTPRVRAGRIHE
ncbi:MAG: non-heme iron oxygenase ferredoxin subunit [Armatimonadota bacterium]|nr:non-heme iron oxygenase ferredoxin subunit [Armatimonadota bacterium]MDR7443737.1 non-heme iron oxygenase ferredoxin subunit [Armatimonadota bacterium]MDR7613735.1 non-heme iron oxygenase ferredoxin subunit [Armatimonadota bacterium]